MASPLISVVVPVYNVEKYLPYCIESITAQSHENLEVILVDDGSTDNSGKICDHYACLDKRIAVIHQDNQGISEARNNGIDLAKGSYLALIDGDDYIDSNMLEVLLGLLLENKAEIAACNLQRVPADRAGTFTNGEQQEGKVSVYTGQEAMLQILKKNGTAQVVVWNKLYKRNLFTNIRFPRGKLCEDEFTTYKLFHRASTVAYIDSRLYYYVQRPNSIARTNSMQRKLDGLQTLREQAEYYEHHGLREVHSLAKLRYMKYMVGFHQMLQKDPVMNNKFSRSLKQDFDRQFKGSDFKKLLDWKERLYLRLFYYSPLIYRLAGRLRKKVAQIRNTGESDRK